MRRIGIALVIGGSCLIASAAEIGGVLAQAGKACATLPGRVEVTAESQNSDWRVTGLSLSGTSLADADLEKVVELTTLESLKIAYQDFPKASEKGWHNLATISNLRQLTLQGNVAEKVLKPLTALAKLESLNLIGGEKLGDATLVAIEDFPNLRRLNLFVAGLTDDSMIHIKALVGLEELGLSNNSVSDASLTELSGLTHLQSLKLDRIGPKAEVALKGLPQLEKLEIASYLAGDNVIDFSGWRNVKALKLGGEFDSEGKGIRLPPDLRWLKIGPNPINKASGSKLLDPLPTNLKSVHLRASGDSDLGWLGALPELTELTFEYEMRGEYPKEMIAAIVQLKRLEVLILSGGWCGEVTDQNLQQLAGLRQLDSLVIEDSEMLTDAGLEKLGAWRSLRRLELGFIPKVTAAGLANVWSLDKLEVLRLDLSSEATGNFAAEALAGIASLGNLRELTLSGRITDEGLVKLAKLKNLHRLDLARCQGHTDKALAGLVNALPELKVVVWGFVSSK